MRGKLVGLVGVVRLVTLVGLVTLITGLMCCGGVMGQSQAALQIHDAHWIWMSGGECVTDKPVYLRKTFNVASTPLGAALQVACVDHYKIWINGQLLGETRSPGAMSWRVSDVYLSLIHI